MLVSLHGDRTLSGTCGWSTRKQQLVALIPHVFTLRCLQGRLLCAFTLRVSTRSAAVCPHTQGVYRVGCCVPLHSGCLQVRLLCAFTLRVFTGSAAVCPHTQGVYRVGCCVPLHLGCLQGLHTWGVYRVGCCVPSHSGCLQGRLMCALTFKVSTGSSLGHQTKNSLPVIVG